MYSGLLDELRNYQNDGYGEQFVQKENKYTLLQGEMLLFGKDPILDPRTEKKLRSILNPMFEDSLNIEQVRSAGKEKEKEEKCSAVLVANHSSILSYLQYLLKSGRQKFDARAYLWHYQYADIESAIESVQNVAEQYYYFAHGE